MGMAQVLDVRAVAVVSLLELEAAGLGELPGMRRGLALVSQSQERRLRGVRPA
jgi:hypothetical protein